MFFRYLLFAYLIGCVYLFVRGWQSLEIIGRWRVWFAVLFGVVTLSFAVMRQRIVSGALYDVCYTVGFTMLAVVLYGFLFLLFIDILRIVGWVGKIKPDFIYRNYRLTKFILFGAVFLMLSVVLVAGYYNAHHPRTTHLTITVDKKAGHLTSLRVAMVSDIHLGNIHGRKMLAKIVNTINEQGPDIVFLVGDIFDGNPETAIENDMGVEFNHLRAKYGVYMVNGNHERIGERGGQGIALNYLVSHGIQPLLDSVVLIDGSFYVAGRKDGSSRARKTIPELLTGADRQLPIILLDHQPNNLHEAEQSGIDLQLSGHTHHGQMWPLNYFTGKIFEHDWGLLQKGKSNIYISCGVGTWGPPIRTSGYSEVVIIDLKGKLKI
jgi:predicted MPP superfamily phosphohydrolase